MKEVRSNQAPAPVGPYSQAIDAGSFVYCSGQIALDPKTGTLVGKTAAEQTVQVMSNVKAVLQAAGLGTSNIVKTTIFLTDIADFADVNTVYEKELDGQKPARSTVGVAALPKGARVEIECIALRACAK